MESLVIKCVAVFIALVITAVSSYVMQFLKMKLTDDELEVLKGFIKVAVMCANQIFTPEEWKEKKEYVLAQVKDFINEKLKIKLTEEQIDLLIEGIVNEVKNNDSTRCVA